MVVDERGTFRQDSFQKAVAALSDAAAEAAGAGAGARPRSRGPGAPGHVPAGSRSVASTEAAPLEAVAGGSRRHGVKSARRGQGRRRTDARYARPLTR